jgi:2-hydroxy-palmitic acid dioxygenase Mpo1-like protein
MAPDQDFEAFWKKFLADHPSAMNRWAHVAALAAGAGGVGWALLQRSKGPAIVGLSLAAALAIGGHPVFQGDWPKNFGRPLWAARAFLRLCARTLTGRAGVELAAIHAEAAAEGRSPSWAT